MSKKRKLHFVEIGKGRLGKEVQSAFEQASLSARDLNGKTTVVLKINVYPPNPADPTFGNADYSLSIIEPPKKSIKFTTLLHDGLIINEGENEVAALQYDLDLDTNSNITLFTEGKAANE